MEEREDPNEVLFTFSSMVDDIDVKVLLLELVFRGGECSVASSRRPYTTPAAVPHTLRETRLSSKWSKPSLQVKAGCYEDVREENYQLTGAVRGILGIVVVPSLFYCQVSVS